MCSQITEEADTNNHVEPHSRVMIKLVRVDTNSQPASNYMNYKVNLVDISHIMFIKRYGGI